MRQVWHSRDCRWGGERGAAAVEFALVLPILVLLFFGIIQFSIAYNDVQGLHAAAREGARLGSLNSTTAAAIEARVLDALDGVQVEDPVVTLGSDGKCPNAAGKVEVVVTANYTIDIPLWGEAAKTLTGRGVFRCE